MDMLAAFYRVDIRVGRIVTCETFPAARKPAYKLNFDFDNALPTKRSSAQLPPSYPDPRSLIAHPAVCVTNFKERRVAGFQSQVLTLGMSDADGKVWLVLPERHEGVVGRRVVLEGCDELPAEPVVEVEEFSNLGIKKGSDRFIYCGGQRLGVRMGDGSFVPLIAPQQAEDGAVLH